jgi:hypothetical protein
LGRSSQHACGCHSCASWQLCAWYSAGQRRLLPLQSISQRWSCMHARRHPTGMWARTRACSFGGHLDLPQLSLSSAPGTVRHCPLLLAPRCNKRCECEGSSGLKPPVLVVVGVEGGGGVGGWGWGVGVCAHCVSTPATCQVHLDFPQHCSTCSWGVMRWWWCVTVSARLSVGGWTGGWVE